MTILVGYAPSKAADAALDTALDIARSTGERVVVVNAGPGGEHRARLNFATSPEILEEAVRRIGDAVATL